MSKPRKPNKLKRGLRVVPRSIREKYPNIRFISSGPAAQLVGISQSEMWQRTQAGIYPCVHDDEKRAWYDEAQLLRLLTNDKAVRLAARELRKEKRREIAEYETLEAEKKVHKNNPLATGAIPLSKYPAHLAARVFHEFEHGRTVENVIIDLEVHPEQAIAIRDAYARVKSSLFLTPEQMTALSDLPIPGWPPKSGDQFVACMKYLLGRDMKKCVKCGEAHARLCAPCAARVKASDEARVAAPHGANGSANGAAEAEEAPVSGPI